MYTYIYIYTLELNRKSNFFKRKYSEKKYIYIYIYILNIEQLKQNF